MKLWGPRLETLSTLFNCKFCFSLRLKLHLSREIDNSEKVLQSWVKEEQTSGTWLGCNISQNLI